MLLDDVETYLNTFGTWSQSGTTYAIRKNLIPDTPDAVIVLIEFPAGPGIKAMGASLRAPLRERAGLMVTVRGPRGDYANARAMAEVVNGRLDSLRSTLSGRRYYVTAMHTFMLKEQDRNDRWKLECNYLVLKERG